MLRGQRYDHIKTSLLSSWGHIIRLAANGIDVPFSPNIKWANNFANINTTGIEAFFRAFCRQIIRLIANGIDVPFSPNIKWAYASRTEIRPY